MSELKLCPFCGGEAQVNTWTMHGITESRCFCPNSDCPNSVRTVSLEQWNTRPIEDALTARIAECESALISMVQQFFYNKDGEDEFRHAFMSAEEEAATYLVEHGIACWTDDYKSAIRFVGA